MLNYQRKALLLSNGLTKKVKKLSRLTRQLYENDKMEDIEMETFLFCCENNCSIEDVEDCKKINDATYHRDIRCKTKIECILSYSESPVFLTLTFTDETLSKTSQKTRRKYVVEYLKSQSAIYVANIDYGGKNGREHYHAIVIGKVDRTKWSKYGSINFKIIHNSEDDIKRVSKYVSKLTNHAIKNTTKGNRVIYSR